MKYKIIVATAITALFFAYACDEKYEQKEYDGYYDNYVPIVSTFFAGDKDSCTYYDYEPDIVFTTQYSTNGYFEYSQSFDLDNDGINDFAIGINGYKDISKAESNYWRTTNLHPLNGYSVAMGSVEYVYDSIWGGTVALRSGGDNVGALPYGDTLTGNSFDFNYRTKKSQMIESGYNYSMNSYDTCCGNWNVLGEDRYIGFQKFDGDTIIGWMRLEMSAYTDLIILKDCAIQKFSEKHN